LVGVVLLVGVLVGVVLLVVLLVLVVVVLLVVEEGVRLGKESKCKVGKVRREAAMARDFLSGI